MSLKKLPGRIAYFRRWELKLNLLKISFLCMGLENDELQFNKHLNMHNY